MYKVLITKWSSKDNTYDRHRIKHEYDSTTNKLIIMNKDIQ